MATSKSRLNLMSLPKTVRNQIYWLAMKPDPDDKEDQEKYRWDDGRPVLLLQSEGTDKYGADYCNDTKWWLQPAITKVSRKVRKEALPVYYGNIEFQVHGTGYIDQLGAAGDSLEHIGKNARWIKHLRVFYEYDDMEDNLKEETLKYLKPIPSRSITMKMRRAPMSVLARIGAELAGELTEEYDDMEEVERCRLLGCDKVECRDIFYRCSLYKACLQGNVLLWTCESRRFHRLFGSDQVALMSQFIHMPLLPLIDDLL